MVGGGRGDNGLVHKRNFKIIVSVDETRMIVCWWWIWLEVGVLIRVKVGIL